MAGTRMKEGLGEIEAGVKAHFSRNGNKKHRPIAYMPGIYYFSGIITLSPMGLDSVELVMKVEKTFGIHIPDQEAEKIVTVGDMYNAVWQHLEGKHSEVHKVCKSQALFYQLRQAVIDTFQLSRQDFRPNALMNDIFPLQNRRQVYTSFARTHQLQLPDLVLTASWSSFLTWLGFVSILGGLGCALLLIFFFDFSNWTLLMPVAGIALTWLTSTILEPRRTVIEPASVRQFTQQVLALNYATLVQEQGVNREEVESVINHIIVDVVGVELHEVTPEAKFTDDLGID